MIFLLPSSLRMKIPTPLAPLFVVFLFFRILFSLAKSVPLNVNAALLLPQSNSLISKLLPVLLLALAQSLSETISDLLIAGKVIRELGLSILQDVDVTVPLKLIILLFFFSVVLLLSANTFMLEEITNNADSNLI